MSVYQPDSRRPIAGGFRATANACVHWCVRRRIHPDVISYSSIVAAAAAGLAFWQSGAQPGLLIPAVLLCYVRLWLNMLDGMVALASGRASRRGELVNDLPDRVSDVLIFAGVAHSGWCHPATAYWVIVFALLVPYVGIFGQALGGRREFSGVMAKPWRMVLLNAGAWTTLALIGWNEGRIAWGGLTVLDWTHLLIIVGCVQTIWVRLRRIVGALPPQDTE